MKLPSSHCDAAIRLRHVTSAFLAVFWIGTGCSESAVGPGPDQLTIAISPASLTLATGATRQLSAIVRTAGGDTVGHPVEWSSDSPGIARVDATGLVQAILPGSTAISARVASSNGRADVKRVTIVVTEGGTLEIAPAWTVLTVGQAVRLTATARRPNGAQVGNAGVTWSSRDGTIATTTGAGDVIGKAAGVVMILAVWEAAVDTAFVEVRPADERMALSTASAASRFVESVGVNTHISYLNRVYGSGWKSIIKPRIAELGVRHLRDGADVWPDSGWMSLVYGRYREVAEATGARFTLIMRPAGTAAGPGTNFADASHVRILLDRIGADNVEAFEGLNEFDHFGNTSGWEQRVRTFQQALHAQIDGDPTLASRYAVLGPSLANAGNASRVGDLSAFMDHPVMHPYPGGHEPRHDLEYNFATLRPMNGSGAPVATETGYHTTASWTGGHPGVSERAMGKYVPRLFLEYFAAGIVRTFSYELIDQGTDPADNEMNFGLLRVDGSPKPAFVSLRNLIALLSDPGPSFPPGGLAFALEGDTTGVHHLLFQKRDGRFFLVLWQSVSSYDVQGRRDLEPAGRALTLKLASLAGSVRQYEPFAGSSPISRLESTAEAKLVVRDHPLVIEIRR